MGILNMLKEILTINNDNSMRVGLSGFKTTKTVSNTTTGLKSINNKDVKLSDLMRRTNVL